MSNAARSLWILPFLSAVAFAQTPDTKTCSVDGTVLNSATGAPILRAQISVAAGNEVYPAVSAETGKWSVEHSACGRVSITATRVGFLRSAPTNVLLVRDTPLHGVKISVTPQAVLSGRVVDDAGDPIFGAQVGLLDSRIQNGVRGFQHFTSTTTNDLGEYRFSGLAAGKYVACANSGFGNGVSPLGQKCYPGEPEGGVASAISVASGTESRIDFALSRITTFRVSGAVAGQQELANVALYPRSSFGGMYVNLSTTARPDGSFSISGVPPGAYNLIAISSRRLTARVPLDVGVNDVEKLQVHLEPGVTVTGTIKAVSATGRVIDKAENQFSNVLLKSADGTFGGNSISWGAAKTTFTLGEVMPGSYHLEFSPPPPFYLKSATLAGRDIASSDVPIGAGGGNIEVVIADDGGAVEGDVSTDEGPSPAWVYVERDGTPSRNTRADSSGHFKIETVPPGDYKVYAWDDNTNVEYSNPEWMRRNGKAVAVTVGPSQTAQVKLVRQTAPPE